MQLAHIPDLPALIYPAIKRPVLRNLQFLPCAIILRAMDANFFADSEPKPGISALSPPNVLPQRTHNAL